MGMRVNKENVPIYLQTINNVTGAVNTARCRDRSIIWQSTVVRTGDRGFLSVSMRRLMPNNTKHVSYHGQNTSSPICSDRCVMEPSEQPPTSAMKTKADIRHILLPGRDQHVSPSTGRHGSALSRDRFVRLLSLSGNASLLTAITSHEVLNLTQSTVSPLCFYNEQQTFPCRNPGRVFDKTTAHKRPRKAPSPATVGWQ